MNNKNIFFILIIVLIIVVVGSSLKKPLTKGLLSKGKMLQITVTDQSGISRTFNDKKAISTFISTITGAKKIPGILDTVKQEYTAEILFENNKTNKYYIWLNDGSEQGKLMDPEDTNTGYSISKKATKELKSLLKEAE
ncbi:MAG: hypothetical protein ACYCX4_10885 [Bacillota bacterium]